MPVKPEQLLSLQKQIMIDACITQSILIVLYGLIIVRMCIYHNLKFILCLCLLLMSTCVTWIFINYFTLKIVAINARFDTNQASFTC